MRKDILVTIINSLVFSNISCITARPSVRILLPAIYANCKECRISLLAQFLGQGNLTTYFPALKDLRWIPVKSHLYLRDAILAFKSMTGQVPNYLSSNFIFSICFPGLIYCDHEPLWLCYFWVYIDVRLSSLLAWTVCQLFFSKIPQPFPQKSHECALKLTDLRNTSLLFDLNYKFDLIGASLLALAKSKYYNCKRVCKMIEKKILASGGLFSLLQGIEKSVVSKNGIRERCMCKISLENPLKMS